MTRGPLFVALLTACCAGAAVSSAQAQSMTPMRGTIRSTSEEFALKVFPRNIYNHAIDFDVLVYDQDFRPIAATVYPSSFRVGPGGVRAVTVVVPFDGTRRRKVRVCAESIPFPQQPSVIKAQICGKFIAERLQ